MKNGVSSYLQDVIDELSLFRAFQIELKNFQEFALEFKYLFSVLLQVVSYGLVIWNFVDEKESTNPTKTNMNLTPGLDFNPYSTH